MSEIASARPAPKEKKPRLVVPIIFGVLLPACTLTIELFTSLCAEALVDPIPSLLHVLLVASVPATIGLAISQSRSGRTNTRGSVGLGIALGVTGYYALLFLPVTPLAIAAIAFFGIGLLALAPLISWIVALRLALQRKRRGVATRPVWIAAAATWTLLLGAEVHAVVQRVASSWAISHDLELRTRGLSLLRDYGDREALLRACYRQRVDAFGMLPLLVHFSLPSPTPEQARALYFQVTGVPFGTEPGPPTRALRNMFDADVASEEVGGKVPDLVLASSQLDASIATDDALGYVEWTMRFHNDSEVQREARGLLALPSGSVVSRATLWVNGEPRDATFAAEGQAREAYTSVVARRRDPLLVTQVSPERVLVQCFPVEAHSDMKIRVGITFPLHPTSETQAQFTLPYFAEHNFQMPRAGSTAVWVESDAPLSGPSDLRPLPSGHGLHGVLTAEALHTTGWRAPLSVNLVRLVPLPAHAAGPSASEAVPLSTWVEQRFLKEPGTHTSRWFVALDTSASLDESKESIAHALAVLSRSAPLTLLLAADGTPREARFAAHTDEAHMVGFLEQVEFEGGRDSMAALTRAIERASFAGPSHVVWITAAQPRDVGDLDELLQWVTRAKSDVQVVPFVMGQGEPWVLGELPEHRVERPLRVGGALEDLEAYASSYVAGGPGWQRVYERTAEPAALVTPKESQHIVRLWVAEQVAAGCPGLTREQCTQMAAKAQIVTGLTGAVVLENAQQYAEAGLTQATGTDVPTVPEPATWLLMVLLAGFAGMLAFKERSFA